jgi:hypothetical protein
LDLAFLWESKWKIMFSRSLSLLLGNGPVNHQWDFKLAQSCVQLMLLLGGLIATATCASVASGAMLSLVCHGVLSVAGIRYIVANVLRTWTPVFLLRKTFWFLRRTLIGAFYQLDALSWLFNQVNCIDWTLQSKQKVTLLPFHLAQLDSRQ